MAARIPATILRRIRNLIREGHTNAAISRAVGVSIGTVVNQSALMRANGERLDRRVNYAVESSIRARTAYSASHMKRGGDFDEANLDLVDIFSAPRTPRQIRRAMGGGQ